MSTATTLVAADLFPDGTTVGAYLRSGWTAGTFPQAGVAPPVASVTTAVAASGQVAFTGLTDATDYVAAAQVGGVWKVIGFSTKTARSTFGQVDAAVTAEVARATAAESLALPKSLVDAKGDLLAASAADTPARVPVGSNGKVLVADSAAAAGVSWANKDIWANGLPRIAAPTIMQPGLTLQTQTGVAQRLLVQRFVPDRNMAITTISFEVITADTANNPVHVGLVDSAGLLLATSGAVLGKLNAGARLCAVALGSTVNLTAGAVYGACLLVPTITTSLQIRGANLGGSGSYPALLYAADGGSVPVFPNGPWSYWNSQTVIGNLTLGSLAANQGGPVLGVGES